MRLSQRTGSLFCVKRSVWFQTCDKCVDLIIDSRYASVGSIFVTTSINAMGGILQNKRPTVTKLL